MKTLETIAKRVARGCRLLLRLLRGAGWTRSTVDEPRRQERRVPPPGLTGKVTLNLKDEQVLLSVLKTVGVAPEDFYRIRNQPAEDRHQGESLSRLLDRMSAPDGEPEEEETMLPEVAPPAAAADWDLEDFVAQLKEKVLASLPPASPK